MSAPPRISCAEAVLRAMRDAGATELFGIPGRAVYPLLDQLPKVPGLRYVTGLHEFPLASIADGYARATRSAVFLNLYMSTGTLNASSAVFLAQRDRVPLVVTATQAESWAVGADHRAEVTDIVEMMRPITKWAWMPPTPQRVPEALRRAHTIATTPPRGPTFVAIPVDYWHEPVEYRSTPTERLEVEADAAGPGIDQLAVEVRAAARPCFVIGYEAIAEGLGGPLSAAAEQLGAAVIAEPEPPMLPIATDHPLFGGSVAEACDVIADADLVVHVGVNTYEAFHQQVLASGNPKRHLWLGTSGAELNKVAVADVAVIGPLAPAARALIRQLSDRPPPRGVVEARRQRAIGLIADERAPVEASRQAAWDDQPMSVARLCCELRQLLPPETVLVDHSTTAVRQVRQHFPVPSGEQYISASGSCQGWGIGAAVGVQLADPVRPVLGVVGDGGFMFGLQAVWTAGEYELPLLAVVLDNGGWSSMRTSLARNSPALAATGTELGFGWQVDIAGAARAMGVDAITITTPADVVAAVGSRLPLRRPLVVHAVVRREPKTSASPFVGY